MLPGAVKSGWPTDGFFWNGLWGCLATLLPGWASAVLGGWICSPLFTGGSVRLCPEGGAELTAP